MSGFVTCGSASGIFAEINFAKRYVYSKEKPNSVLLYIPFDLFGLSFSVTYCFNISNLAFHCNFK